MNSAPESLHSLDSGQRWPLLLGASVALLVSLVFVGRAVASAGCAGCCRTYVCPREQGDPVTRDFAHGRFDEQRCDNLMGLSAMIAFWGMVNCLLIVVNTTIGNPRWMTVGQDITVCAATLYAVGGYFWLKRARMASVVLVTYVGFMLLLTCFVSSSSETQVLFIGVAVAAKFFQGLFSMAAMSPALAAGMALLLSVLSNIAYMGTEMPCKKGFSMTQSTFAIWEVVSSMLIIVVTIAWKRRSASRIDSEIEMSISQGETRAARKLLNTVCDATVELDASLNIVSDASRLAILLQHGPGRSLQGAPLLQFVVEEDRDKFREQFTKAAVVEDIANMFNVRVRDSISSVVNVEILLVAVASPITCTSYLVGVREFSDSEAGCGTSLCCPTAGWGGPLAGVLEDGAAGAALPFRVAGSCLAGAGGDPLGGQAAEQSGQGTSSSEPGVSDRSDGGSIPSAEDCDEADADTVAIYFDALSSAYEIERASGGFHIFLSPRRRENHFIQWLQPSEVEPFVSWVQATLNGMLRLPRSEGVARPALLPQELHFRPGLVRRLGFGVACTVALDLPPCRRTAGSARLTLTDVQLVRWSCPRSRAARRTREGQRAPPRPPVGPGASAGAAPRAAIIQL